MTEQKDKRDWIVRLAASLGLKETQARQVRQWAVLGLMGVMLLLAYTAFTDVAGSSRPREPVGATAVSSPNVAAGTAMVDEQLSRILSEKLSRVEGAGAVDVTVTLESSEERVYGQNVVRTSRQTTERDTAGASRTTTETTDNTQAVMGRAYSQSTGDGPVVTKTMAPRVKGVVVVADGAHSPVVTTNLTLAVQALLDVPANRIMVLPREGKVQP
ncbi:MAG: hypothetical protein ACYC5Y_12050 [Symbiobacteriia bacterium]